ncbi:MAG: type II toxin-antitoxin system Phd/YefM family antitoxin [Propionibacteriaceae bacterium]|jgi:antitoxin (DNA-binding transcriptional repressor) of toxin-antitoxin stability system|nr:type II toxin-antitoxin system Phd/YefM family antitoxin [Propionibacteriaceae bacterium]
MPTVTVHQAKTQLSQLLVQVENGQSIIIARGHQPVAKLVALSADAGRRRLGGLRDKGLIADEHFAADEIAELFGAKA